MAARRNNGHTIAGDGRSAFRRPSRRVAVRKAVWWKRILRAAGRAALVLLLLAAVGGAGYSAFVFVRDSGLFRLRTAEAVEILGARHVDPEAVRARFAEDVGRSLFWLPLAERRASVEEIPWVEAAAVERFLPGRVRVFLRERSPVAYLRQGNYLWLLDAEGVLLPIPEGSDYDFPVLMGIPESFSRQQRAVRVQLYLDMLGEMDAGGGAYRARISEVDVSDLDDMTAVITAPAGSLRVHFGRGRYLEKFRTLLEHQALWANRRDTVESVDLRYRGQIILNPDRAGVAPR